MIYLFLRKLFERCVRFPWTRHNVAVVGRCRDSGTLRHIYELWCCLPQSEKNSNWVVAHGPLTRCVKLRFAHVPGTFSPPPRVSNPDMYHGTCVTHVPWCMLGSLTICFLWGRWREKRSRRMRNPQFYLSGKRSIAYDISVLENRDLLRHFVLYR